MYKYIYIYVIHRLYIINIFIFKVLWVFASFCQFFARLVWSTIADICCLCCCWLLLLADNAGCCYWFLILKEYLLGNCRCVWSKTKLYIAPQQLHCGTFKKKFFFHCREKKYLASVFKYTY